MWRYKKTALSINVERTFTTDIKSESGSSYFNFLSINFPSNFMQCQISLSKVLILFCDWFKRKCRLTSTTDNCCQRAKVHRLVAQPGLFAKCHDHVALYILGTCVIFLRLLHSALSKYPKCESALHYFSKCESALHYFSKCESALHYFSKCESALLFNFSKCKQALIFYSGCKPALIFYSSKYETVSNFCFKTLISAYFNFWNMHQLLL